MRNLIYAALISTLIPASSYAQSEMKFVLEGSKEQAIAILERAMKAEFSDGVLGGVNGRIGRSVRFKKLWSRFPSAVRRIDAVLTPVGKSGDLTATAHLIEFYGADHSDQDYIKDLMDQIEKQLRDGLQSVKVARNQDEYKDLNKLALECLQRLSQDSELLTLQGKVALGLSADQTFEMKANNNVPTDAEREVIKQWASKRGVCDAVAGVKMGYFPEDLSVPLIKSAVRATEGLLLHLYYGELSYARFALLRQEIGDSLSDSLRKVREILAEKKNNAQERARIIAIEEERVAAQKSIAISERIKAQAAETAARAAAQNAQINAVRPPAPQASEIPWPRSINCTTTKSFGSIQTQCN